ncbi:uncharacterized protein LOC116173529 [Photinus pyralis]|uniref:uncharacterized protein LOC116173529 n=1 Tax=Photinus pyralis TaxID=7054 RepID=UPI0012673DAD|nr:uncharacterized protein LOC116173529 [Photinus pyralis]
MFSGNYTLYRNDRVARKGGGTLVAVRNNFSSTKINLPRTLDELEITLVKLKLNANQYLIIVNAYIPPNTAAATYEELFHALEEVLYLEAYVIFTGDFNIPEYFACNSKSAGSAVLGSEKYVLLKNFLDFGDYVQINKVVNINNRILDLIIVPKTLTCDVMQDIQPLVKVDCHHPPLMSLLQVTSKVKSINFQRKLTPSYNFKKANYFGLYTAMANIDWEVLYSCVDVNTACKYLYQNVYSTLDQFVPKTAGSRNQLKYPPWFNGDIVRQLRIKERSRALYIKTRKVRDKESFQIERRELKRMINNAKSSYINCTEQTLKQNPNALWRLVNSMKKSTRIPGEMRFGTEILASPEGIVNGFARHFQDIFTPLINTVQKLPNKSLDYMCFTLVSEEDVIKSLKKLKSKSTAGLDGIPSFILRDCWPVLVKPLTHLFNLIIRTSEFPVMWKCAKVIPILKSGDPADITNYRQISLLNNFSKVFECVLHEKIFTSVMNFLSKDQHAFIPRRSTCTNLVNFTQYVSNAMDVNKQGNHYNDDDALVLHQRLEREITEKRMLEETQMGFGKGRRHIILHRLVEKELEKMKDNKKIPVRRKEEKDAYAQSGDMEVECMG